MSRIEYQSPERTRYGVAWAILTIAILFALGAGWWGFDRLLRGPGRGEGYTFHTVAPITLEILIQKDGELQAVKNTDIVRQVEGQSTIRTIVPEGSIVKQGDPLFELDSSDLRRRIQTAQLEMQKAESDLTAAREQLSIQQSKNAADLEAAAVELKLARLEFSEYIEGKYPQQRSEAERGVQMAEISLKSKEQALAQTRALLVKGFVTQAEVEKSQLELVTAQNEFEKKTAELRVLCTFTHERELADKQNKVAQAEKKVARVQSENASTLAQKVADAQTRERALVIHTATLEHLERQLGHCTVTAPTDGIVVYGSSVPSMFFRETPVQAGAQVREQQLVVRLPETSAMKAVARVGEHQAVTLHVDPGRPIRCRVRIVGRPEPFDGSVTNINVLSDTMQRWWNPDLKEFPVDITLDHTPPGLKPGTSCSVEILVDRLDDVLAVPVGSIYTWQQRNYVWVRHGAGLLRSEVQIGRSNDTHVEITQGLTAGQQVLLLQAGQGRSLIGESGADEPAPATMPADPGRPTAVARSETPP